MKKRLFLLSGLLLSFSTLVYATPQLVIPEPSFNFGSMVQGEKLHHTFTIKNTGDTPMSVLRIVPSCGCTAANIASSVIQPGKTGDIKIVFDSTNFSGKVTKNVAVETNDPKSPNYTLTLNGTVVEEIQITPRQVNLGQIKAGSAAKATLTLTNRGSKPLKILSAKAQVPQITAEVKKPLLKTGESGNIEITATPHTTDRILSGYLTLTTDSPRKNEIVIPVYGSLAK